MNTRLIAIISSIALLSSTTTSIDTPTPMPGNGGSSVPATSSSTSQTTLNPSAMPSTSTKSHTANLSHSPSVSTNPTLTSTISVTTHKNTTNITKPNNSTDNNMNKTDIHTSNINNSSVLEENTTEVPSGTTEAPLTNPHTTIRTSTNLPCNCSKYLSTSTTSVSKQTQTEAPTTLSTSTPPTTTATMVPSSNTSLSKKLSSTNTPTLNTTAAPTNTPSPTLNTTVAPTNTPSLTLNTTTAPTNTPSPTLNTTTAPTNTPSPTLNTTTAPTNTPSQTLNTTTAPTNTPSQTLNTTTAHTNTPSPTLNTTVASTNTPSPTLNTTTATTNTPSPTLNTTVAPKNTPTLNTTTAPLTSIATTTTSSTSTTPSTTTTLTIATTKQARRRRRGVVYVEVDEIQSEDISDVYDDTSSYDLFCMNQCNITMNETTTEPPLTTTKRPTTTTPKPTTTTPRHRSIDLSGKLVDLNLVIVVMGNFTEDLKNHSSKNYTNLAKQYKTSLNQFYRRLLPAKFKKIVILGFSNGSIKCNYLLEMNAPINESNANSTLQILRNVNWTTDSLANLTLDVNKTTTAQAALSSNDLVFLPPNVCVNNEVLEWDDDGNPICKYKCDTPVYKGKCGDHGECSFTYGGVFRCICKDGYSGNKCEPPKPTTTTAKPIKPDDIALSKIDIIGIAGGIGGGLILILLVALCCVYTKLNKAKKRDRFYGYMDNDKEFLHDENSRIENVPDLKNEYTNLGYQTEQNELQMQRFEPEGKNVEYEPGQRQGAYERDDKAYRQVEEPEGGNVLIYQPKHLNGPMERQSGASKFDEVEERSNPYRMMDTDTTYKIRRPTVNSDRNVPYN
ncbi:mucin-2-like [Mytilus edulis]|uniref:mucin-2-like n=1 Tax=Mytilus edulis TaxID=6550 RepID=UPI0039F08B5F